MKDVYVLVSRPNPQWQKLKEEYADKINVLFLMRNELEKPVKGIEYLITTGVSEQELANLPDLKCIYAPKTGTDTFPLKQMEERGIRITISHANAFYVAEHGVALAMCMLRNLYGINARIRKGEETKSAIGMRSLQNMNIGIMGYGHIGAAIAELLKPYDVNIAVYTLGHIDGVRNCATPKELFACSDLVFNCLPLFESTRNLIGYEELSLLKDRWLVNVSRAEIIQEEALYRALSENILAGYAADVWYQENWRYGKHNYDEFDNVIITPHCAANVADGRRRYMVDALTSAINE